MMDVGSHVKVTEGEHHGKRGTIVGVKMHNANADNLSVTPVVRFESGDEAEIPGPYLKLIL